MKLTQKYLDDICQDIHDYIEERFALDGIQSSGVDPIEIFVARSTPHFIGGKEGKKCYKVESRIHVNLTTIERE